LKRFKMAKEKKEKELSEEEKTKGLDPKRFTR
jgi:hypothetical protein